MRKHLILLLLALIGIANTSTAQETQATQWLTDSSKAIQFGIGNNFGVQTFDNKSLSFKMHISNLTAIRIALSGYGSNSKGELTTRTFVHDTLVSSETVSSNPGSSLNLSVSSHFLWYVETGSDVFLFLGAGPLVEYSRSDDSYYERVTRWAFGISSAIGVEWFATRHVSIHAEYQAAGRYSSTRSTEVDDRSPGVIEYDRHTKTWRFDSQKVLFGLSVYF